MTANPNGQSEGATSAPDITAIVDVVHGAIQSELRTFDTLEQLRQRHEGEVPGRGTVEVRIRRQHLNQSAGQGIVVRLRGADERPYTEDELRMIIDLALEGLEIAEPVHSLTIGTNEFALVVSPREPADSSD